MYVAGTELLYHAHQQAADDGAAQAVDPAEHRGREALYEEEETHVRVEECQGRHQNCRGTRESGTYSKSPQEYALDRHTDKASGFDIAGCRLHPLAHAREIEEEGEAHQYHATGCNNDELLRQHRDDSEVDRLRRKQRRECQVVTRPTPEIACGAFEQERQTERREQHAHHSLPDEWSEPDIEREQANRGGSHHCQQGRGDVAEVGKKVKAIGEVTAEHDLLAMREIYDPRGFVEN